MNVQKKRILLINPAKEDGFLVTRIHMGLTLIGGLLKARGHDVKLIDYAFLRSVRNRVKTPLLEEVIGEYKPDLIGISVFTYLFDECCNMIDRVSSCVDVPIILGGPHFSIFPDNFSDDKRISYILRGEADKCVVDIVENAKRQTTPVVVDCPFPSASEIPSVDLSIAYGCEHLAEYQIQLSRGCPYHCTFCNVASIAGTKVRTRDLDSCLDEIVAARMKLPLLRRVVITDDCPTCDVDRFKRFLRGFKEMVPGLEISIDNVRANLLDEELLDLYVKVGGVNICLGVESGDPVVFGSVNKGESLDEIVWAAKEIKKRNLLLGLCFVIGLPEDNMKRHKHSVDLAMRLRPDYTFWNMCVPWPRTKIYEWFYEHGEIGDLRNFSTLIDSHGEFRLPVACSPDFTKEERVSAWLMANMKVHRYFVYPRDAGKLFKLAVKYRVFGAFLVYFRKTFLPVFWEYLTFVPGGLVRKLRCFLGRAKK